MPLTRTFQQALAALAARQVMPTTMTSQELAALDPALKERALFSARVSNASFLQHLAGLLETIVNPKTVARTDEELQRGADLGLDLAPARTQGMDYATARLALKDELARMHYRPGPEKAGTVEDLSSDKRLDLILRTNTEMAQGYGHWAQGQDEAVLDAWPAQELYRAEARDLERDWKGRWRQSAASVNDVGALRVLEQSGRMISLKNAPIWEALATIFPDALGNPYPPFAFRSGMDVRDVARSEAVDMGLIDQDTRIPPQTRNLDTPLEIGDDLRRWLPD